MCFHQENVSSRNVVVDDLEEDETRRRRSGMTSFVCVGFRISLIMLLTIWVGIGLSLWLNCCMRDKKEVSVPALKLKLNLHISK